jgi:hypothetical protein
MCYLIKSVLEFNPLPSDERGAHYQSEGINFIPARRVKELLGEFFTLLNSRRINNVLLVLLHLIFVVLPPH